MVGDGPHGDHEMANPYRPPSPSSPASMPLRFEPADRENAFTTLFEVTRRAWMPLLAVYLIVWMPLDLITCYCNMHVFDEEDFMSSIRLQSTLEFWFGTIAKGGLTAMAMAVAGQHPPNMGVAFKVSLTRYAKQLTTQFCVSVVMLLGLVLLVVPGVYFIVRSIYAPSIAVCENVHGPTAIARSFELTRGRFGETCTYIAAMTGVYLATMVLYGVAVLAMVLVSNEPSWGWVVDAFASQILAVAVIFSTVLAYGGYRRRTSQVERLTS